jgi:agmatine/peptidylarginine deiminase
MLRALIISALTCLASACGVASQTSVEMSISEKELIVLAAPPVSDDYYMDVADDIRAFHIAYARAILDAGDDVLILVPKRSVEAYAELIDDKHVMPVPQQDIWMRDFTLANPVAPIMFRYTAAGQGNGRKGQAEADYVQDVFASLAEKTGLRFQESDLLNDGGNWVDDYDGRVVLSRKFLRDNQMTEEEAREALRLETGVTHIAFIEADEQGGLEHADGVVAFVAPNVLIINSYPEDPDYARVLKQDLGEGLPGVILHEIVTPYDGREIYDERFGSACGLYTNMLVTPHRIYLPQFGIPEDAEALAQVRAATDKQVIPVRSDQVCHMGGGVRCLSMQMRGANALALKRASDRL